MVLKWDNHAAVGVLVYVFFWNFGNQCSLPIYPFLDSWIMIFHILLWCLTGTSTKPWRGLSIFFNLEQNTTYIHNMDLPTFMSRPLFGRGLALKRPSASAVYSAQVQRNDHPWHRPMVVEETEGSSNSIGHLNGGSSNVFTAISPKITGWWQLK